ncbi:MAG: hypothetical protein ACHQNE_00385 [Candidatus Kapaibacterium sp.]
MKDSDVLLQILTYTVDNNVRLRGLQENVAYLMAKAHDGGFHVPLKSPLAQSQENMALVLSAIENHLPGITELLNVQK